MFRQLHSLFLIFFVCLLHSCIEDAVADSGIDKACQQGIMRAKNDLSKNKIRITIPGMDSKLRFYAEEMIYQYYGKEIEIEPVLITCGTGFDETWEMNNSCYKKFMDSIVSGFGVNVFQRVLAGADSLYQLHPARYPEFGIRPSFPGGDSAMNKALSKNIHYPVAAKRDSIQGKVLVMVLVDERGKINEAKVVKGVRSDLDSAAVMSVLTMMKGLPLTYNRDMQLDKEPLFNSFEVVSKELKILCGLLQTLKFNKEKIEEYLKDESLYATDLVYYLVDKEIPFKEAHSIVGKLVKYSMDNSLEIKAMPQKTLKKFSDKFVKAEIIKLFNPKTSLDSKKSIQRPS